jgi:chemotaxis protein histidine kinase CheA
MTRFSLQATLAPMRDILSEMQSKRLVHTAEIMPALLGQLNAVQTVVTASSAPAAIANRARNVRQEESDLWDELQKMSSDKTNPTGEEKTQSESLRAEQSDVEQQTQQLRKKIQALSQKTASLGAPLLHSLGQAGSDMNDSSGALSQGQAPSAQKSQVRALDALRSAQDDMQRAQSMMSEMSSGEGGMPGGENGGGSGGIQVIRRGGGGSQGSNNGKVRLPTAADYRPPKAFREDLLEALKERYTKTYEDVIRQYYKRLAN